MKIFNEHSEIFDSKLSILNNLLNIYLRKKYPLG